MNKLKVEHWTAKRIKKSLQFEMNERKKTMILAAKYGIKLPNDILSKMIEKQLSWKV